MTKKKSAIDLGRVDIQSMRKEGRIDPAITFDGEAPKAGDTVNFELENGVTYTGTVFDAVAADGNVLVEFDGDIKPTT